MGSLTISWSILTCFSSSVNLLFYLRRAKINDKCFGVFIFRLKIILKPGILNLFKDADDGVDSTVDSSGYPLAENRHHHQEEEEEMGEVEEEIEMIPQNREHANDVILIIYWYCIANFTSTA